MKNCTHSFLDFEKSCTIPITFGFEESKTCNRNCTYYSLSQNLLAQFSISYFLGITIII
jgi:hypothetical protein